MGCCMWGGGGVWIEIGVVSTAALLVAPPEGDDDIAYIALDGRAAESFAELNGGVGWDSGNE